MKLTQFIDAALLMVPLLLVVVACGSLFLQTLYGPLNRLHRAKLELEIIEKLNAICSSREYNKDNLEFLTGQITQIGLNPLFIYKILQLDAPIAFPVTLDAINSLRVRRLSPIWVYACAVSIAMAYLLVFRQYRSPQLEHSTLVFSVEDVRMISGFLITALIAVAGYFYARRTTLYVRPDQFEREYITSIDKSRMLLELEIKITQGSDYVVSGLLGMIIGLVSGMSGAIIGAGAVLR